MRKTVAFLVAALLSFTGVEAHATPAPMTAQSKHQSVPKNSEDTLFSEGSKIQRLSGSQFQVSTPDHQYQVTVDKAAGTATVIDENNNEQTFKIPNTRGNSEQGKPVVTPYLNWSSVPCAMLLWAVGIIHHVGWTAAAGIIAAEGPAGAALAAAIWAYGVDAFFALVGSQC